MSTSRLEAYSDRSRRLGYKTCECGNERSRNAQACKRCTYLDGVREAAFVIDALRGTDGLSITEICALTGTTYHEAMQRALKRLMRIGRVRRYWRETDAHLVERSPSRRKWGTRGGSGCWVYALDGATEREWRAA